MSVKYQTNECQAEFNYYSEDDKILDQLPQIGNNLGSAVEGASKQRMITEGPSHQSSKQKSFWNPFT